MIIKNEEGYADPTYGGAYKTIRQEEKRKQDEADAARVSWKGSREWNSL